MPGLLSEGDGSQVSAAAPHLGSPPGSELYLDRPWKMLIDGALSEARSGQSVPVVNPATEAVIAHIPDAGEDDVDVAVAAAVRAAPLWAETPISQRADVLLAIADIVENNGEEFAWIDMYDNGSPIRMTRGDYRLAVQNLRYFAGLALQLRGDTIPVADANAIDFTVRDPFGVVGRIVPFNHPLLFAASSIAAPLLAGNVIVLKPADSTTLSTLRLGELIADVIPPGVVNIVTGPGDRVGDRIVTHPDVRRIAFTGSEAVGRRIQARAASAAVKTVSLELGGKNPVVVFGDADIDKAVEGALNGMNLRWQGQSCGSTSRLFIHRSIFEDVVGQLAARMNKLKVGDPRLDSTEVGALVSEAHYERVTSFIRMGLDDPELELRTSGDPPKRPGFFVRPTLFSAPRGPSGPLFTDEIFGPVFVAAPFDTYQEVIALANSLRVGLTASVWTTNLTTAMSAVRDLQAGYVWINASSSHIPGAPFGGVKNSGVGREEGIEELQSYTQLKNVYVRY